MLAEARSLAGTAGALRPLLHVAINESHVLEGIGEHERAAQVARAGIASAQGLWPGPHDRHLPGDQRGRAARLARPLGRGHRGHRACPGAFPAAAQPARAAAARRRYRVAPRRPGRRAGSWPTPPGRGSAGPGSRGHREAQYYLPLAQLEAELFLAEGEAGGRAGRGDGRGGPFRPRARCPVRMAAARRGRPCLRRARHRQGPRPRRNGRAICSAGFARWPRRWTPGAQCSRPAASPSPPRSAPSSRMRPTAIRTWRTAGPWRNGTRRRRPGRMLPSPTRSPWRCCGPPMRP